MENIMAKAMNERYEDYLNTKEVECRATKNIYYWIMSTVESIFWGFERNVEIYAKLYATEEKMFLIFWDVKGECRRYEYYVTQNINNSNIPTILKDVSNIINNITYPVTNSTLFPSFHAKYYGKEKAGKCKGKYRLDIFVNMLSKS